MDVLTISQARKILRKRGLMWFSYQDLRQIELETADSDVKGAAIRLSHYITRGR